MLMIEDMPKPAGPQSAITVPDVTILTIVSDARADCYCRDVSVIDSRPNGEGVRWPVFGWLPEKECSLSPDRVSFVLW